MDRPPRRVLRPHFDRLDDRCLPSGLSPPQLAFAYGLSAVNFNTGGRITPATGAGQTIAIVDAFHDPFLASDLHTFDQAYRLADPLLMQVNQAGGATNGGWAGEEALDVEWAHALAPGARIVVVEARSDALPDLMAAVNTARNLPSVSAVSMSWGGGEMRNQTIYDAIFTTPAGHVGVTFLAASGDDGPGGGAEWPASSPNVVGVGGTTLRLGPAGLAQGEVAWSGSSGGVSLFEAEPSYQRGIQATGRRTTPDVAFDADPFTGVAVYSTSPASGRAGWHTVGGTSLGAPAWAAIVALADQGRALVGKGSLDGVSQALPALYALPSGDFHGVVSFFGGASTTGLGTPNGSMLVNALAFGASPTAGGTPTGTTGGGQGNGTPGLTPIRPRPIFGWPFGGSTGLPVHILSRTAPTTIADLAPGPVVTVIGLPPSAGVPALSTSGPHAPRAHDVFDVILRELGSEGLA
jgi:subtilase family serine protease